jgi:DNA-binding XRE family transcriptional regulator
MSADPHHALAPKEMGCEHMFVSSPSPELLALAQTIRRLRRARELSQEALAARADINPKHLSEIERANKDPRATTVIRLADALGLTPAELYAHTEETPGGDGGKPAPDSGTGPDGGRSARS